MINSIENNIIVLFGKIASNNTKYEIDNLIINSIKLIAKAIREVDLHLRINLLIMVLESIFLLENDDFKMEKKCKRRMNELLNPNYGKNHQSLFETLTNMYEIRHKMTHKSIRKYIEPKLLSHFQVNIVEVIFRLLAVNYKIQDKENLIKILDKNSTNA